MTYTHRDSELQPTPDEAAKLSSVQLMMAAIRRQRATSRVHTGVYAVSFMPLLGRAQVEADRGELLSQSDVLRDGIVVVHLLGLGFARKALEWFVGSATHPAALPNAPQLAAGPAEEMDTGRPAPECGRRHGAAGRTVWPIRNVGFLPWHVEVDQSPINFGAARNVHD